MAKKKSEDYYDFSAIHEHIEDVSVNEEMEKSFLEYAYSVIYSRALPDARDGLKPVQRRIVYQMNKMSLHSNGPFVKSARVVGDVMGKLHPHGDSAIYDAMVRLSQPFVQRINLVDGHGNFGSLDDGPAAPRYTEVRSAVAAEYLCQDLNEDTVNFVPNYDNKYQEPEVLPAAYPNLLVNGASGIAVGMATNMAPHNLGEVIDASVYIFRNPDATLKEIMRIIPGPDLPEGSLISGTEGILEAYETGRGTFTMRAKVEVDESKKRTQLIITELPFGVGPEKIMAAVKSKVQEKRLVGIHSIVDLTDRKYGLRIVIDVKNGFEHEVILEQIYKLTPCQENFAINNVALDNGTPKTLGLLQMLHIYNNHRMIVIKRRTNYRLNSARERLHLVEGLLLAIINIDEVIRIIRTSDSTDAARTELKRKFSLDDVQAEYILDLRLRRLTKFERVELETEQEALLKKINELQSLLNDDGLLTNLIVDELEATKQSLATPRRSKILTKSMQNEIAEKQSEVVKAMNRKAEDSVESSAKIKAEDVIVAVTIKGELARISATINEVNEQIAQSPNTNIKKIFQTSTQNYIGIVSSQGVIYGYTAADLPKISKIQELSTNSAEVKHLVTFGSSKETFVDVVSLNDERPLAFGTARGIVKRLAFEEYRIASRGELKGELIWPAMKVDDGDTIIGVDFAQDPDQIVFVSDDSSLLIYDAAKVRAQGRTGGGVAGLKLAEGAKALYFGVVPAADIDSALLLMVSGTASGLAGVQPGFAKVTPLYLYPQKGRATGGVRAIRFLKGQDITIFAGVGTPDSSGNLKAVTANGKQVRLPAINPRRDGSGEAIEAAVFAVISAVIPTSTVIPAKAGIQEVETQSATDSVIPAVIQSGTDLAEVETQPAPETVPSTYRDSSSATNLAEVQISIQSATDLEEAETSQAPETVPEPVEPEPTPEPLSTPETVPTNPEPVPPIPIQPAPTQPAQTPAQNEEEDDDNFSIEDSLPHPHDPDYDPDEDGDDPFSGALF
jgi:DNA gyrase subunit A